MVLPLPITTPFHPMSSSITHVPMTSTSSPPPFFSHYHTSLSPENPPISYIPSYHCYQPATDNPTPNPISPPVTSHVSIPPMMFPTISFCILIPCHISCCCSCCGVSTIPPTPLPIIMSHIVISPYIVSHNVLLCHFPT